MRPDLAGEVKGANHTRRACGAMQGGGGKIILTGRGAQDARTWSLNCRRRDPGRSCPDGMSLFREKGGGKNRLSGLIQGLYTVPKFILRFYGGK